MLIDEEGQISVGSDHNFMTLNLSLANVEERKPNQPRPFEKWNINDSTDWPKFRLHVQNNFTNWNSNSFSSIDDMWQSFKTILIQAGKSTVGCKSYTSKRVYWDTEVNKLIQNRRKANRLYRIWSKHPDCSPELLALLWDDYMEKKKKVTDRVKSNIMKHKTDVIIKNAQNAATNPRAYWKMLSRINKANGYPLQIQHPQYPDILVDDPIMIRKILTSYWSQIGTVKNAQSEKEANITMLQSLANRTPQATSLHTLNISIQNVKDSICKLKIGKATGADNIPAEFIKYGGQILGNVILQLFMRIKLMEQLPQDWFEGIVKPLYKSGNNKVLNNYRGITISSIMYKCFVSIIEDQVMDYAEKNRVFGETQGAFRKNRQCEDNIFTVKGICAIRKSKKQKTFLAFIDISKAFDTVNRDLLFIKLWDIGIQGKIWKMIKALYERVDNKVIFGPYESDHFEVVNGVKQGCVLSPCLFNLVITDLDYMLMDSGGISFGANEIHGLYYADDIILFGVNEGSLQRKLDIASAFASKWNLKYNHTKSQVVVIGEKDKQRSWNLGGNSITETKSYCYLGTMLTSSLKDSLHINQHLYRKAMKLLSYMQYTLAKHRDINRIDFADSIYNKAILPSLAHAAGTWFAETKCSQDKLTAIQYKFAKAATKLKCTPSSDALIAELGWLPINDHLDMKRLSYHE